MLSGQYFPYHPKPLPDELLSSLILRIALGHGQKPHGFCQAVWPGLNVWTRDIDSFVPPVLISSLSEHIGSTVERLTQATLAAYEGELMEIHFPRGRSKWVLRGGIYHRLRRNPWLQFCPHCLAEDVEPYFRRSWRLALVSTCSKHSVVLRDRCPACNEVVVPHRAAALHLCHKCGFDLRNTPAEHAYFPALVLQRKCEAMLVQGWGEVAEVLFLRSILFFDLLHQVLRVISTGTRSQKLRAFVANRWGGDPSPPAFPEGSREIEALAAEDRHRLMGLAAQVLEGWPWRYIGACGETGNWRSWALKDIKNSPYAYSEAIDGYLSYPTSFKSSL